MARKGMVIKMKILSIGNSFSQDAQRYLHRLAKHDGVNIKTVNLYIGGCPLRKHYLNILDDKSAYSFEFNGENTGLFVSIRQVTNLNLELSALHLTLPVLPICLTLW